MTYNPPISDMSFLLEHVTGFRNLPHAEELDPETVDAILAEAAKLASDVLAPLNKTGDEHGNILKNGAVTTTPGFKEAYRQYCAGGWNAVPFPNEFDGQGLPWSLAFPIQEMWQGANLSFGLCPLLNQGAVDAILEHGSEEQKAYYLPKLISGEWTGTMNLTEPQAGSDLAAVKTKAEPAKDGTYKVFGQKIYITYGEHDMSENIIHLVLARLPNAPEGVKGISLFIVPKFLEDGTRNDVICTGLEHKLGIHASPTCTMQFGDQGGATGFLVGEAHQGLKYMFTMMNNARLSVGLQGVAIAERALQHAEHYARERVQGKGLSSGESVTIDHHPDVQRMLLTMKALTMAGRAMAYDASVYLDQARAGDEAAQIQVDLLTPIIKSWCTDMACEVASIGVQIHGGMGFVEETGAAQYYRDARILPIYEGTNGIQANDLLFRKILRDQGAALTSFYTDIKKTLADNVQAAEIFAHLDDVLSMIKLNKDLENLAFIAVPLLNGLGVLKGAEMMTKMASANDKYNDLSDFYMRNILPRARMSFDVVYLNLKT